MSSRKSAYAARNAAADAAYEKALAPARLPSGHPDRVPYPDALRAACAAYDEVIREHQPLVDEEVAP